MQKACIRVGVGKRISLINEYLKCEGFLFNVGIMGLEYRRCEYAI